MPHFALELAIFNHDQVRIEEYLFRRFEADAMLREIALRFLRVPDEFDFNFFHCSYDIVATSTGLYRIQILTNFSVFTESVFPNGHLMTCDCRI